MHVHPAMHIHSDLAVKGGSPCLDAINLDARKKELLEARFETKVSPATPACVAPPSQSWTDWLLPFHFQLGAPDGFAAGTSANLMHVALPTTAPNAGDSNLSAGSHHSSGCGDDTAATNLMDHVRLYCIFHIVFPPCFQQYWICILCHQSFNTLRGMRLCPVQHSD